MSPRFLIAALAVLLSSAARADSLADCNSVGIERRIKGCSALISMYKGPESAGAYVRRGLAYGSSKQFEKALSDFEKALQFQPKNTQYKLYRGMALKDLRRHADALKEFTDVISLEPNAFAYNERGTIHYAYERSDEAIADFSRAIQLKSDFTNAYYNRGLQYAKLKKSAEAESDFSSVLTYDAKDVGAYVARAELRVNSGRYTAALEDLNQAIRLDPNNGEAYFHRARVHATQGRYRDAVTDASKSHDIRPTDGVMLNRGIYRVHVGDAQGALKDLEQARLRGANRELIELYSGFAHALSGSYAQAEEHMTQAIARAPNNHLYYYVRSAIRNELGKKMESEADLKHARQLRASVDFLPRPSTESINFVLRLPMGPGIENTPEKAK